MIKMKKVKILVKGRVQGVFFRDYTKRKADELGIKGYVTNLDSGEVLAVAVGDEKSIRLFIDWCYEGSPYSDVRDMEITEYDPDEQYSEFSIRF
jgi:acylphosphatase